MLLASSVVCRVAVPCSVGSGRISYMVQLSLNSVGDKTLKIQPRVNRYTHIPHHTTSWRNITYPPSPSLSSP